MNEYLLFVLAGISLLTLFCQWFAWWVKLPAILFLLVSGIIVGPEFRWLNPDVVFGHLLNPIIQLSVAIILFEGSLTLNFDEIHAMRKVVRNLVTIGTLITTVSVMFLAHWLFQLNYLVAALFGAIVSVSGPTVIVPLLRTVRPNANVANVLRWEGIIIDPIGALLAVLIYGFINATHGSASISQVMLQFSEMIVVASVIGLVVGYWLGVALRRHWIPEFLHNVMAFTLVICVFSISNRIDEGSGLLAITLMGIILANMKEVNIEDILGFKESLSILLISGLFIILAANISFTHLHELLGTTCILILFLQFVIRPLNVFICTIGSRCNWRERLLLSWIAPRGIVAAAVSALFAIRLKQLDIKGYDEIVLMTFLVIIGTVIFQSLTARVVANVLGVSEPEPRGFLIIGANIVSRKIAKALMDKDYQVLLTALNWDSVHTARMEGLNAYYGNPISEHADRHLDLVGIGGMLALSPQDDLNTLAALRYKREFGSKNVFNLSTKPVDTTKEIDKHSVATRHQGYILFGNDVTYTKLASLIAKGAEIRSTQLTKTFDFKSYQMAHDHKAIPLFALDPKQRLFMFTTERELNVGEGWTIVSLIPNED